MKLTRITAAALLGASLAFPFVAEAQPAKGGRYGFNAENTRGWSMMTAEERAAHQSKMQAAKTADECKATQDEHRKLMEERAKAKGTTLGTPKFDACEQMRAQGMLK